MDRLNFNNSLAMAIKSSSKSLEKTLDKTLRVMGYPAGSQWKVIIALSVKDGISQREIADMVFVEGSTLVPIIDRMEKEDLVKRKADDQDRRNNRIFLTEKSQSLAKAMIDVILDLRKKVTKNISGQDLEITMKTLRKVIQNAEDCYSSMANPPSTVDK